MIKTVYYLTHWQANKRIRYYTSRTGARIAMRLHNLHLGFRQRTSRAVMGAYEYEVYCIESDTVYGTYCIVEDCIESPEDLLS